MALAPPRRSHLLRLSTRFMSVMEIEFGGPVSGARKEKEMVTVSGDTVEFRSGHVPLLFLGF